jgi:uncharacterized membrane protein (UPF0127 family)
LRPLRPARCNPDRAYRIHDITRGTTVVEAASAAVTWWQRLIGLLGRRQLDPREGVLFPSCRSVHTCLMRTPIDVVVVDRAARVLRCYPGLRSWRIIRPLWRAWAILELSPGALQRAGVRFGDQLAIEELPQTDS